MTKHEAQWVVTDLKNISTHAAERATFALRNTVFDLVSQTIQTLNTDQDTLSRHAVMTALYQLQVRLADLDLPSLAEQSLTGMVDYARFYRRDEVLPDSSTQLSTR